MPRKARLDAPGALHHVIGRGIERRKIFIDTTDRDQFVARLSRILTETGTPCFAWALLPNHFHLLLKTGSIPIATVMRRLLTGYAVFFNRRHQRHGQLFQNRYKSFLCQEDTYLLELVRYIHLNPLRAGIVDDVDRLETYPYCGHGVLTGDAFNDWQDRGAVLRLFGLQRKRAIAAYRRFVEKESPLKRRPDLTGGGLVRSHGGWASVEQIRRDGARLKGDERILGDSEFVKAVLQQADEALSRSHQLKAEGVGLDEMARWVTEAMGVPVETVWEKSRRPVVVNAKSLLCYRAHHELGISMTELGRWVGLTQPAVSIAVRRGERLAVRMRTDKT